MKTILLVAVFILSASFTLANSYAYIPIQRIPKADEILAFSNGKPPAVGSRKKLKVEDIQKYLAEGIIISDKEKWRFPVGYTTKDQKNGVFFDSRGIAYFWSIWEEGVLVLETESGESIQIVLK